MNALFEFSENSSLNFNFIGCLFSVYNIQGWIVLYTVLSAKFISKNSMKNHNFSTLITMDPIFQP